MSTSCEHFGRRGFRVRGAAAAVFVAGCVGVVPAGVPAVTYTQGNIAYQGGPQGSFSDGYTFGWEFTTNAPITVDALAVADAFAPGLILSHTLFLWDSSRNVLRSVAVVAGAEPGGALGANEYRYFDISPIALEAGRTYTVGVGWPIVPSGSVVTDYFYTVNLASSREFEPRINFVQGRITSQLNRFPGQGLGPGDIGLNVVGSCNFRISTPVCVGDLNFDGAVNTLDLTRFLGLFGTATTNGGPGDFNNDGAVNTADLTTFLGRFGTPCPAA